MESKYGSRRKPSSGRGLLLAALVSFVAGGMLVGYVVWYNLAPRLTADGKPGDPKVASSPAAAGTDRASNLISPPTPIAEALEKIEENPKEAVEAVKSVAEQQGGIEQRLAAAEQRLARLDLQAEAAAGNAARAEGLLIAFAVRRLIERGDELGYLADQLRIRFGDERPNAVSTIINFSRREQPIRIDNLIARLEGLRGDLRKNDSGPSWNAFTRELGALFVVRRQSTPSPQPARRLDRAKRALEQGRYQSAIDEIKQMPGAARAEAWIADAEEFRRVMEALENIEKAAVLDQLGPRDGKGQPVSSIPAPTSRGN